MSEDFIITSRSVMTKEQHNKERMEKFNKEYRNLLLKSRKVDLKLAKSTQLTSKFLDNTAVIVVNNATSKKEDDPITKIDNWLYYQIIHEVFYGVMFVEEFKERDPDNGRRSIRTFYVRFSDERDYKNFEQDVIFGSKLAQE